MLHPLKRSNSPVDGVAWGCCRKPAGPGPRAIYFVGTNIQATTVKKPAQLAT
jgi:hypothetical protein